MNETKASRRRRKDRTSESIASAGTVVRVLTVSDLHQRIALLNDLSQAVEAHAPDVVVIVGDVLEAIHVDAVQQFSAAECAPRLAELPVDHLLFIRGNHEDANWTEFVATWPHTQRKVVSLYGTSYAAGPLVIVGFPCMMGSEFAWCAHLAADSNEMELIPAQCRAELPSDHKLWLPQLLRQSGPAGRTLWLMHEPAVWYPLATPQTSNPEWTRAVETFQPLLTISGHDHQTPAQSRKWHAKLGSSTCVNVGQAGAELRFCVLDFHFASASAGLPTEVEIVAYPTKERLLVRSR